MRPSVGPPAFPTLAIASLALALMAGSCAPQVTSLPTSSQLPAFAPSWESTLPPPTHPDVPRTPTSPSSPTPPVRVVDINDYFGLEGIDFRYAAWMDSDTFVAALNWDPEEPLPSNEPLAWWAFDLNARSRTSAQPLLPSDPDFWSRAGVKPLQRYPELDGYFSPSGRLAILSEFRGESFSPSARTDVSVAEVPTGRVVWQTSFPGNYTYLSSVAWRQEESRVFFIGSYEGPATIYVLDLAGSALRELSDIADVSGVTEGGMSVSSDGLRIVYVDLDFSLRLVDTSTGASHRLNGPITQSPQWSHDDERVYYWWSGSWDVVSELREVTVTTGQDAVLFTAEDIAKAYIAPEDTLRRCASGPPMGGRFAISPDGTAILLYDQCQGPLLVQLSTPGA